MANKYIQFCHYHPFKVGDVVRYDSFGKDYLVVKVYEDNWFKRILRSLKIKTRINVVKVKFL